MAGDFNGVNGTSGSNCNFLGPPPTPTTPAGQPTTASLTTRINANSSTTSITTTIAPTTTTTTAATTTALIMETGTWSYAHCPFKDYCAISGSVCIGNSTCNNTASSYECICNDGYAASSVPNPGTALNPCLPVCVDGCGSNGYCGSPDLCSCYLGWAGANCSIDCGCNFHAACVNESTFGICNNCQNNTIGSTCNQCAPGYWGNPLQGGSCAQCSCNLHADPTKGYCNGTTGSCFCDAVTTGVNCSSCVPNYWGNPVNGGMCIAGCNFESRGYSSNPAWNYRSQLSGNQGYFGITQNPKMPWFDNSTCIWMIESPFNHSTITVEFIS